VRRQLRRSLGCAGGGPARFKKSQIREMFLGKSGPGALERNGAADSEGKSRRLGPAVPITTGSRAVWFNYLIDKAASPYCCPKNRDRLFFALSPRPDRLIFAPLRRAFCRIRTHSFALMIGSYRQSSASLRTARRRSVERPRLVVRIGASLSKRAG
jgi:hypothetical protein